MNSRTCTFAVAAAALSALVTTRAQVRAAPPFFGRSGVAFDPEISIVESGAKLDAQATVSADRKYVTLTMRPQLANLVALREFTFQNGPQQGIVGLPQQQVGNGNANGNGNGNGGGANGAGANGAQAPAAAPAPAPARPAQATVLEREGMVRLVIEAPPAAADPPRRTRARRQAE